MNRATEKVLIAAEMLQRVAELIKQWEGDRTQITRHEASKEVWAVMDGVMNKYD